MEAIFGTDVTNIQERRIRVWEGFNGVEWNSISKRIGLLYPQFAFNVLNSILVDFTEINVMNWKMIKSCVKWKWFLFMFKLNEIDNDEV